MLDKIRVLIVDDSMVFRTMIVNSLKKEPIVEVVGTAGSAFEAKDKILKLKPDVVTLDIVMPGMNGLEFLKILMAQHPIPVVVVSGADSNVFDAVGAGAVDFVAKPSGDGITDFAHDLALKLKAAVQAKLRPRVAQVKQIHDSISDLSGIIAIGASTGGTEATSLLLRALPAKLPGIVITQHMPPVFTKMYAERLNRECPLIVKEAKTGDIVKPGHVFIAPGDLHMTVSKANNEFMIRCQPGEKVSGHCPSVDVLFDSVAKCAGAKGIGIILTGMGSDGAKGLLNMRKNGAFTIGQDQKTCVVYGMPMEAFNLGAVMRQAPLENIPGVLLSFLKK